MQDQSKCSRKAMSHSGGLIAGGLRPSGSPVANHIFDPSNAVYKLAMELMWPEFCARIGYNQLTLGDIMEAILATWLQKPERSKQDTHYRAGKWLHNYLYSVYMLVFLAGDASWHLKSKEACENFVLWSR